MILSSSTYRPMLPFLSRHFNTIYRTLFHDLEVSYERERMETADGDFMDLDFSRVGSDKLAVLVHGLEGSSASKYILAQARICNEMGLDVAAVNLRGCSGEPNRLLSSYHSGKTEDLHEVLSYLDERHSYRNIYLVGYSLGGNLILKYLGEERGDHPPGIRAAVAISVPCDLKGSAEAIGKFWNMVYMQRFLISLRRKSVAKLQQFPDSGLNEEDLLRAKNFHEFDNLFTAPVNGFRDAQDYWEQNSSLHFLQGIRTPSLLITATDDPFLSASCIPYEEARSHEYFHLEASRYGGHVGFNANFDAGSGFWLERRVIDFLLDPSC